MSHPYRQGQAYTRWRQSMAEPPRERIDPVVRFPFRIDRADKVATAGSCFAQHIARSLVANGFNYYLAEKPHLIVSKVAKDFNYETFSARYGNIYTGRQLLQLAQRAFGTFEPEEEIWTNAEGAFVDPFRPSVQPGGFVSHSELLADREQHLGCVRTMLRELDYFVFTLGLTELWSSAADGAAYPICPGVLGGTFDPDRHCYTNLGVEEIVSDMGAFFALLKEVNPRARMILTVSPVALAATAEDRHVLVSTTYSKAVLRVAAETLASRHADIAYFPSYEIILGQHAGGAYLAPDLREVNADGVAHVMRLFAEHCTDGAAGPAVRPQEDDQEARQKALLAGVEKLVKAECDEAMLDPLNPGRSEAARTEAAPAAPHRTGINRALGRLRSYMGRPPAL